MSEELEHSQLDIIHSSSEDMTPEEEKLDEQDAHFLAQLMEMNFDESIARRVVGNGNADIEAAVETILRHSENQVKRASGTIQCSICQEPLNLSNMTDLIVCLDSFCKTCLQNYLKIRIEEGQVLNMPCPNHECRSEISEFAIKSLVSPALFDKYTSFKNNEELSRDPFLRWCPKPDCNGYDTGSLQKNQLTCSVCKFNYCYYCSEAWHPGKTKCKASSEKEMDRWAQSHGVKICPNCKRKVEKALGCDHMTCIKCRYEWCWLCGEKHSNSHYPVCEVRILKKKNPGMDVVLKILLAPLILVFLPVVLAGAFVQKQIDSGRGSHRFREFLMNKWLSFSLAGFCGLVFAPLFFAIAPLAMSVMITIQCYKKMHCRNTGGIISAIITGIVFCPILIAGVIAASGIAVVVGLALLGYKLYIVIRRCKDPYYLKPRNRYGFA